MKKYVKDLRVVAREMLREDYLLLRLTDEQAPLPPMLPGQFVQIAVEGSPATFLRRPISINDHDAARNTFDLLIHCVGEGTRALLRLQPGDRLNCIYPLGNGFAVPAPADPPKRMLLVGGGVGTAPMLLYGRRLHDAGCRTTFLLGGRSSRDILQQERFSRFGTVCVTTEDGTLGQRGLVTHHSLWTTHDFDAVAACGPKPMMAAVARAAREHQLPCHVSLENLMACGVGACLCCVEKTVRGNLCVCTDGPVFNTNDLTWE